MLNFAPWFVFCQGILCPFLPLFTKILQIYYIKFAFSFFFRNFVAYLRVLCLHVGASEYKEPRIMTEDKILSTMNTTIETHKWLDCSDENYWVEDNEELNGDYFTIVSMPSDTWDEKSDLPIHEELIFLHANCPYSWSILAKSGGKFMVTEKPQK